MGICRMTRGTQNGDNLEGWGWAAGLRETQEGGDIGTLNG